MTLSRMNRLWAMRGVVLGGVLAILGSPALADEPIGVIKRAKATCASSAAASTSPPPRGTLIQRGDRVITGPNGYASVTMRRTAPITLGSRQRRGARPLCGRREPEVTRAGPRYCRGCLVLRGEPAGYRG